MNPIITYKPLRFLHGEAAATSHLLAPRPELEVVLPVVLRLVELDSVWQLARSLEGAHLIRHVLVDNVRLVVLQS